MLSRGSCLSGAQVFYGQWRGLAVAIKVAPPGAEHRPATLEEFRREITTMASLAPHPNLLPLLAARTQAPTLALLTPFCARGELALVIGAHPDHGDLLCLSCLALAATVGLCSIGAGCCAVSTSVMTGSLGPPRPCCSRALAALSTGRRRHQGPASIHVAANVLFLCVGHSEGHSVIANLFSNHAGGCNSCHIPR